jgi:hypothetical protein
MHSHVDNASIDAATQVIKQALLPRTHSMRPKLASSIAGKASAANRPDRAIWSRYGLQTQTQCTTAAQAFDCGGCPVRK